MNHRWDQKVRLVQELEYIYCQMIFEFFDMGYFFYQRNCAILQGLEKLKKIVESSQNLVLI